VGTRAWRKNRADEYRNPFNDRIIASGSDDGKVFIWEVPQGFTLYSDAEEPADVDPVSKLAGHSRYVRAHHQKAESDFLQKGWTSPIQSCGRKYTCIGIWRLYNQALGYWHRQDAAHIEARGHCPEFVMERKRKLACYNLSR
jgi:WD40 repeat protein